MTTSSTGMTKAIDLLGNGLESSAYKTPEFKNFASKFKAAMKKELIAAGVDASSITFTVGHFEVSGDYQKGEQWFYFSFGDVRGSTMGSEWRLMYRTTEGPKSSVNKHGGNRWTAVNDGVGQRMVR